MQRAWVSLFLVPSAFVLFASFAIGCGPAGRSTSGDGGHEPDLVIPNGQLDRDGGPASGCEAELQGCFTVYAHSDHVLYQLDLANKAIVEVGPFKAQMVMVNKNLVEDTIQDLAVSTKGEIYVVSRNFLYTADAKDGHVTVKGKSSACGGDVVALTFTPDTNLYAADYMTGAFCRIDGYDSNSPVFTKLGTLGQGYAVAGDLVAISDGTLYATAQKINDGSSGPTANDNVLVTLDPKTGAIIKVIGSTGYPKLFGIAFEHGLVFGFTHDGSGDVVTIDPKTGKGLLYNSFVDSAKMKISFAGAGVNADVPPPIVM